MPQIRVLVADDHAMVRQGLRLMLEREPDFAVVAEAGDGAEAVRAGLRPDVDLAILDIAMPKLTGLQVARQLTRQRPDLHVVMLSMHDDEEYLLEALRVGAAGYVLKSAAHRDLIAASRAAARGEAFLYPAAIAVLIRRHLESEGSDRGRDALTPRESEIVKLVGEGLSTKEIADILIISPKTVDRHRANVLQKLGLRDRVDVTRYAIRHGLIEP